MVGGSQHLFWVDPQEDLFGFIWGQYSPILFYPIERQFMVLAYQALV